MSRQGIAAHIVAAVILGAAGWCRAVVNSVPAQMLLFSEWQPNGSVSIVQRDLLTNTNQVLVTGSSGNSGPMPHHFGPIGMAADIAQQRFYYADVNGHAIQRMNFDGTGSATLVTGLTFPRDVALDLAGGKMYWTDSDANVIRRADLNGQNVQTIVNSNLLEAAGLTIDLAHGRIYWVDFHTDLLGSCDLNGANRINIPTPGGGPVDITIDTVNNKLIWADFDSYKIYRSNLNGSNIEVVIDTANVQLPGSVTIDPYQGYLYWNDWGLHKIRRSNLNGSNIVDVYSSPGIASLSGLIFVPEPSILPLIAGAIAIIGLQRRGHGGRSMAR